MMRNACGLVRAGGCRLDSADDSAASFSEVSMRHDDLIQAGPSPDSEVFSLPINVTLSSRERAMPRCCHIQTEKCMSYRRHNLKRERIV